MPDCQTAAPLSSPVKLLDQLRDRIRRLGYAKRTEVSYVHWIKRYIIFQGKRHPKDMGKPEVEAFLAALAGRSWDAPRVFHWLVVRAYDACDPI